MSLYDHYSEKEIAILKARAERIVGTQKPNAEGELISVLMIHMNGETYALPMDELKAVYEDHTIIPVPCTPAFIAGMTAVRGQILPVLDLAVLLGLASTAERRALVVVQNRELTVGLCAEAIGEAAVITAGELRTVPGSTNTAHRDYVQGVTPQGLALLNLEALLTDPSIVVDETIA